MFFIRLRVVLVLSLVGLMGAGCIRVKQDSAEMSEARSQRIALESMFDAAANEARRCQNIWNDFVVENPSLFTDEAIASVYPNSYQPIIDKAIQYARWTKSSLPDDESRHRRLRADMYELSALAEKHAAQRRSIPPEIRSRYDIYYAKRLRAIYGQTQTASTSPPHIAAPRTQPKVIQAAKGWYETTNDGQYLYSKNDEKSSPLGQIGSGIRVKVTEAKDSWAKVTTPFGTSGWIPLSALKKVATTTTP
jgi:Bacterial SH3 domain